MLVCMSHWKVLVCETLTLASCGVSAVRYGSRTMVCNALSHERRLPGSTIDDEFEACFELLLELLLL
jgi:hypothetical protein